MVCQSEVFQVHTVSHSIVFTVFPSMVAEEHPIQLVQRIALIKGLSLYCYRCHLYQGIIKDIDSRQNSPSGEWFLFSGYVEGECV